MFSGLKQAFMNGVEKGRQAYRHHVANAAKVYFTASKYKEHAHQFYEGAKKEYHRTGHQLNKASLLGERSAVRYHTERRLNDWKKEHPRKITNKDHLTIRESLNKKRNHELIQKRKDEHAAKVEEKKQWEARRKAEKVEAEKVKKEEKSNKTKHSQVKKSGYALIKKIPADKPAEAQKLITSYKTMGYETKRVIMKENGASVLAVYVKKSTSSVKKPKTRVKKSIKKAKPYNAIKGWLG